MKIMFNSIQHCQRKRSHKSSSQAPHSKLWGNFHVWNSGSKTYNHADNRVLNPQCCLLLWKGRWMKNDPQKVFRCLASSTQPACSCWTLLTCHPLTEGTGHSDALCLRGQSVRWELSEAQFCFLPYILVTGLTSRLHIPFSNGLTALDIKNWKELKAWGVTVQTKSYSVFAASVNKAQTEATTRGNPPGILFAQ